MATDIETIQGLARSSLMPDFFGVRVDEEGLWNALRQLLAGLKLPTPQPKIAQIQQLAAQAATAVDFIDKLKAANLWTPFKDLLVRTRVK